MNPKLERRPAERASKITAFRSKVTNARAGRADGSTNSGAKQISNLHSECVNIIVITIDVNGILEMAYFTPYSLKHGFREYNASVLR